MGMSSTPKKLSIESHEVMDIKKSLRGGNNNVALAKVLRSNDVHVPSDEKIVTTHGKVLPQDNKVVPTDEKVAFNEEKAAPAPTEEKMCARSLFKGDRNADVHDASKNYKSPRKIMGRKPAEVFRTDFITAMKLPDCQQLLASEYVTLSDAWRQEWEKGVQVAVNPDKMPKPAVRKCCGMYKKEGRSFVLPTEHIQFAKTAYIAAFDRSTTSCDYDLDDVDMHWLKNVTTFRTMKKATSVDELTMERAITWFERQCFDKMAHEVVTKEGLSIEYDETTICNVCLSPDAEDGNEIIFCDACNMCAHQHCYGVLDIPEGNWLCNPCSRGNLSPPCCLCPNKGGAMKRMKDSLEWIHVICAWWVPEVKIEDVKYIERITKDKIPNNRWNLNCSICWEKSGACIQCSVKRCVRAYHITCAVKEGLEMKTVVDPEKDDVTHISFCSKHCTPVPPQVSPHTNPSGEEVESNRLTELRKLESEFYSLVSVNKASRELRLTREVTRRMLSYWTMKRRDNLNTALIPLTLEQQGKLSGKQGVVLLNQQKSLEMERFLYLRQDLERLRNLCYMIVRREKMRKELHRSSIDIFLKQNDILLDKNEDVSGNNIDFIRHRTTNFAKFSELYLTENQYESEHGTKLKGYEDSGEEGDLMNSSVIEHINHEDFNRPSTDGSEMKKLPKGRKSHISNKGNTGDVCHPSTNLVNDMQEDRIESGNTTTMEVEAEESVGKKTKVDIEVSNSMANSKESDSAKTDSERNIFELLVPKSEECSNSEVSELCVFSSTSLSPIINSLPITNTSIMDTSEIHAISHKNKSPRKHRRIRHSIKDKSSIQTESRQATLRKYLSISPKEYQQCLVKEEPLGYEDTRNDLDSISKENIDINTTNIYEEKVNIKSLNSTTLHSPIDVEENAFERFNKFLDSTPVNENGFSTSPEDSKPHVHCGLVPIPNNCINLSTPGVKRKKKRFRNLHPRESRVRRSSLRLHPVKVEIDITGLDDVISSTDDDKTASATVLIIDHVATCPTTSTTTINSVDMTEEISRTITNPTTNSTTISTSTTSTTSKSDCVITTTKIPNPVCSPPNTSLGERLSKLIKETKRRRLNSAGDCVAITENQRPDYEEPPDYVRITRSRRTCSVTGTA